MEILLTLFYTLLLTVFIRRFSFFAIPSLGKGFISLVFILKVMFGMLLTFIYSHYYAERSTADIFKYFDDSMVLYDAFFSQPTDFWKMLFGIMNDNEYFDLHYYSKMNHWLRPFADNYYNDTHGMIRLNAIFRFFSFGYFSVHTVFMCFLSLSGLVAFYKAFSSSLISPSYLFAFGIFFLPSLLFWGSGVLKEGLLLFAMGFLFHSLMPLLNHRFSWKNLLVCLAMAFILLHLKFYVILALIGPLMAFYWAKGERPLKALLKYLVLLLLLFALAINLPLIHENLDPIGMLAQKRKDFICLAEFMNSGSAIQLSSFEESPLGFVKHIPESLLNGLFRPFLWESKSLFMVFSAIETLFLWILLLVVLIHSKNRQKLNWNLLFLSIFFILILALFIGMTTPVLGAIVRYRLPYLLFYLLILDLLADPEKNKLFLRFLKRWTR